VGEMDVPARVMPCVRRIAGYGESRGDRGATQYGMAKPKIAEPEIAEPKIAEPMIVEPMAGPVPRPTHSAPRPETPIDAPLAPNPFLLARDGLSLFPAKQRSDSTFACARVVPMRDRPPPRRHDPACLRKCPCQRVKCPRIVHHAYTVALFVRCTIVYTICGRRLFQGKLKSPDQCSTRARYWKAQHDQRGQAEKR
jgi:hypothetical protein